MNRQGSAIWWRWDGFCSLGVGGHVRVLLGSDRAGKNNYVRPTAGDGFIFDLADPLHELGEIARLCGPYDAVVIDVGDESVARPLLRDLRAGGTAIPSLVLLRVCTEQSQKVLLDNGADDVLAGPVAPDLLCARLRAVQRRMLGHASAKLTCGNVVLDQALRRVTVDDRPVNLTLREIQILETLMLRRRMVLSKENFISRLYPDGDSPGARVIDVFVCKLRRKLAAAGAPEIVHTVWGFGYTLEDPAPSAIAAARARLAAGVPRQRRAHLRQVVA
jgi:two-component system cell cycle response regulator CtrA